MQQWWQCQASRTATMQRIAHISQHELNQCQWPHHDIWSAVTPRKNMAADNNTTFLFVVTRHATSVKQLSFRLARKKQMLCCMSTSIATTFHTHKAQCEQHNSTFEPLQWSNIWSYLGDWQATSNTNCQKAAGQGCLNGNEKPHTTTRNYFVRASDWLPHRQN